MIFPEGTRSATAELLPFKDGAFRLAIDAGVPILPLAVHGTATALPKHDWRFGRSTAVVSVLEPVDTTGLTPTDVPALKAKVRQMIEARDAPAGARDDARSLGLAEVGRRPDPAHRAASASSVST